MYFFAELPHFDRGEEAVGPVGHDQADGRTKSGHQILVKIRGRKFCRHQNLITVNKLINGRIR